MVINNSDKVLAKSIQHAEDDEDEIHGSEYFGAERLQKQQFVQELKNEMSKTLDQIELLQLHSRKLMGQDLDSCSVEELKEITIKLEKSLTIVRSRKAKLNEDTIEKLKAEISGEKEVLNETSSLRQMFEEPTLWMHSRSLESEKSGPSCAYGNMNISDVKTELSIGLPESRE
ncbi:BnaA03g47420D [Brassica napus]|uniref:BnaA03g47420D protein n=2 Tax=Brassica TaxID=3705 RepID=A0A078IIB4_BRANA|nr:BnaA03g47420D [Brassica napus]